MQFYFRLDVLSQAIESVCNDKRREGEWSKRVDEGHAKLIADRLQSCFEPALRAIERLDVPEAESFDEETVRVYPHLRDSGDKLRDALRKLQENPRAKTSARP
jgi:hypothetical protein